jgi:hypothetical protein
MSYRLLKQLAHGLALLVLQRWSGLLLRVEVGVGFDLVAEVVLVGSELAQDAPIAVTAGTTYTITVGAGGTEAALALSS